MPSPKQPAGAWVLLTIVKSGIIKPLVQAPSMDLLFNMNSLDYSSSQYPVLAWQMEKKNSRKHLQTRQMLFFLKLKSVRRIYDNILMHNRKWAEWHETEKDPSHTHPRK